MLHTTLVPIDLESSGEFIFIRYHDFCNMGGERLTLQVEQTIRTLSKEGNSYSVIVKKLKAEGLDVGKATICRVVNGIGKKREAESNGQKFQVDRPRPVRTPATVSKVKRLATTENPPSQRQLSRMCGTSLKTINNIIHKDLELDTRRKGKVHKLTPFHMKNRATNARKLYEEHLAGSRSEYTATLDEAWMYVTYCNGIRKICYIKRGNQVPDNWVHQCSETFPKGFMVVGVMTGRGVLPLIKVPSKVKVNSEFYIECVLKPVIEQLKDLYPGEMDKVFLHHDKASSHTSNKTQQFLQEMKDTLGLNFFRNSDIPVKSPDASPLDFYGFGMLKQRLFNRRPKTEAGLWKAAQEEWSNVSLSKVKEVFAAWKVRCREIAKKKGKHIEHMKKIHISLIMSKSWISLCISAMVLWGYCGCHMPGGGETVRLDHRFFIREIFQRYGDQDVMTLEGFEHLMEELGFSNVVFEDHSLEKHRDASDRFTALHANHNHRLANSTAHPGREDTAPSVREGRTPSELMENLTDIYQSHEEMSPAVKEFHLSQCLTPPEILDTFDVKDGRIEPLAFFHLCPAIVHQLSQKQCRDTGVHIETLPPHTTWPSAYVWLASTLAIFVISVCGFVCVLTIPLLPKAVFTTIQQLFIGLAIGALPGDALLHLLPHALAGEHDEEGHGDDSMAVWKGFTALMGIFVFFLFERLLGMLSSCHKALVQRRRTKENVEHKLSDHPRSSISWTDVRVAKKELDLEGPESKELLPDPQVVFLEPKDHHHEHGHAHDHGHTHNAAAFKSFSAMAMMVIMGDGLHNMCDGLAIGTAFTKSMATGISTSIAVFCHELPHEMGDFAILLSMGLTKKQAFVCNIISSVLCYIANVMGIFLGSSMDLNTWIFLLTAGIFLYLALVVMMPGVKDPSTGDKDFLITVLGIALGVSIMISIALYEEELMSLINF
ncbi:SLC39A5 [Cordylochernes scorpioides]|uniref:SLC39A5 n=1 Tax=Cordylochernes scorpioides TaxID=51811 RepID=A0ABY6LJR3_9ARAC|nr:SLC39A5 [Cordylochernes scorpioides]